MKGLLLVTLTLGPPGDRWFGVDKVQHFVTSAFIQSVSYSALQYAGARHEAALGGATAITLSAGVAKEVWDHRLGRGASARDMAWNAAGAGVASVWLVNSAR